MFHLVFSGVCYPIPAEHYLRTCIVPETILDCWFLIVTMRGLKKFLAAWHVSTVGSMFPKTFLRRKNVSQIHYWLPGTGFECGRFVACLRGVEDWDLRERQTLLNNKHHKTLLDMFAFAAKNNFNCYNVTGTKVLLFLRGLDMNRSC